MTKPKNLLILFIAMLLVLAVGVPFVKHKRSAELKARNVAIEQIKLENEKKAFEEKVVADKKKSEFDKSITSLNLLYVRWNDAVKLADNTARIALSGPVGSLQSIKREADSLLVPECLLEAKRGMVSGMDKTIEGFIVFMNDPNMGKILARGFFEEGGKLLSQYESDSKACSAVSADAK